MDFQWHFDLFVTMLECKEFSQIGERPWHSTSKSESVTNVFNVLQVT